MEQLELHHCLLRCSNIGGNNITDVAIRQHQKSIWDDVVALWRFLTMIFVDEPPSDAEKTLHFEFLVELIKKETDKRIGKLICRHNVSLLLI